MRVAAGRAGMSHLDSRLGNLELVGQEENQRRADLLARVPLTRKRKCAFKTPAKK